MTEERKINYGFYEREPVSAKIVFEQVGPGWTPLLRKLLEDLFELGWSGSVLQVKEKFGGLRFYAGSGEDGVSEAVQKRIDEAESESVTVCEECGEPGKRCGQYWIKTLCEKCEKRYTG